MRRFVVDAGWIFALRVINLPLQFLLFTLAARLHPLAVIGVFAVFFAAWSLSRQLGPCGLDHAANRFIPAFIADGRAGAATRFEWLARAWVAAVTVAAAGAVVLLVLLARRLELLAIEPSALMVGAAAAPGYALVSLFAAQLRARGRPRAAQVPDALVLPVTAALALLGWHVLAGSSLLGLLASHAIAVWLTVLLYLLLAGRPGRAAGERLRPDDVRAIRRMAMTVTAAGAANALAMQLPVLLISAILGAAATGLYEGARRFAQLGTLATWAASAAVAPMLADAHARAQHARLQLLLAASSWAAFLPALAILLLLLVAGPQLLSLFGPGYVAAYPVMLLLATFTAVNASGGLSSTVLNMTGHADAVLRFSLLQLVCIAVAVPMLARLWGLEGAALAVLLSGVLRDGGLCLLLPRRLDLVPGVWSLRGPRLLWQAYLSRHRAGPAAV